MGPHINLATKAKSLVLQDIWKQNPEAIKDVDLTVIIFERDRKRNSWVALIDVKSAMIKERFYEVVYHLEDEVAWVTAYRAQESNPYVVL